MAPASYVHICLSLLFQAQLGIILLALTELPGIGYLKYRLLSSKTKASAATNFIARLLPCAPGSSLKDWSEVLVAGAHVVPTCSR